MVEASSQSWQVSLGWEVGWFLGQAVVSGERKMLVTSEKEKKKKKKEKKDGPLTCPMGGVWVRGGIMLI